MELSGVQIDADQCISKRKTYWFPVVCVREVRTLFKLVFEGPVLGPQKDQGPDRSPGPASVLNGPVLVLNFSGKFRTSPGPVRTGLLPLFNRGSN